MLEILVGLMLLWFIIFLIMLLVRLFGCIGESLLVCWLIGECSLL